MSETTLVHDTVTLDKIIAVRDRWKPHASPFESYEAMLEIDDILTGAKIVAASVLITGFYLAFLYALPGCLA